MQVLSLEASLSAVHNERSQSDMGLKSRMQELLSELQSTLQVWPSLCNSPQIWCCCLSCSCWLNKSMILRHNLGHLSNLRHPQMLFVHPQVTAESLMTSARLYGKYLQMCMAQPDFDEYIHQLERMQHLVANNANVCNNSDSGPDVHRTVECTRPSGSSC